MSKISTDSFDTISRVPICRKKEEKKSKVYHDIHKFSTHRKLIIECANFPNFSSCKVRHFVLHFFPHDIVILWKTVYEMPSRQDVSILYEIHFIIAEKSGKRFEKIRKSVGIQFCMTTDCVC